MPCYQCGKVQTDPAKGASPWARLVTNKQQVLLCPDCQRNDPGWVERSDKCQSCGSSRIAIVLNSVVCRACGKDIPREAL